MNSLLTEVDFINGVDEFYQEDYVTELLAKNANSFELTGIPVAETIRFSGDTTLFIKRVYLEKDLDQSGVWLLEDKTLKIPANFLTSSFTYTYITYKRKSPNKKEGLFSVDYEKGYLYTSTPLKDLEVEYKFSTQYVKADKMKQVDASEYNIGSMYNIPVDNQTRLSYLYRVGTKDTENYTKEYYNDVKVSLLTLGDKDD